MRKYLKTLLLLCFFLINGILWVSKANAQPDTDPCSTANPDAPCPIDGGLSLLLAAGAIYGIKKFRGGQSNRPTHGEL